MITAQPFDRTLQQQTLRWSAVERYDATGVQENMVDELNWKLELIWQKKKSQTIKNKQKIKNPTTAAEQLWPGEDTDVILLVSNPTQSFRVFLQTREELFVQSDCFEFTRRVLNYWRPSSIFEITYCDAAPEPRARRASSAFTESDAACKLTGPPRTPASELATANWRRI